MIELTGFQATALVILVVLLSYYLTRPPRGLPPGPTPWPILGNLPLLAKRPKHAHLVLQQLHQQYGDVISIWMGQILAVYIKDFELVKEAFLHQADIFSDRPSWIHVAKVARWDKGVGFSNGPAWEKIRKFIVMAMRDFGVGKRSLEQMIQQEADMLCQDLKSYDRKPFSFFKHFRQSVCNVITSLCFGEQSDNKDEEMGRLLAAMEDSFSYNPFNNPVNFWPILQYLPFDIFKLHTLEKSTSDIQDLVNRQIEKRREIFDPDEVNSFVDLYLNKEAENVKEELITQENMAKVIVDLFQAGTETSTVALRWIMLYMVHYPEVQARCQEEVDQVLGTTQAPSKTDRPNMTYLDATLNEIFRHSTIVPHGLPHNNRKATTLGGYNIPKDTMILANIYSIHMNPKIWGDPENFRPERWMETDGNIQKKDALMTFSIGPRMCLGDSLAKSIIFIITTTLLQRFCFTPEDDKHLPSLDGEHGLTYYPKEFKVIAEPR